MPRSRPSHFPGIALLAGAALPVELRPTGVVRAAPLPVLVPLLRGVAAAWLVLAVVNGLWLWFANPAGDLANAAFRVKLLLIGGLLAPVAAQHANPAFRAELAGALPAPAVRVTAAASAAVRLAVLAEGRWIGFV